jgi:hypothetical protein
MGCDAKVACISTEPGCSARYHCISPSFITTLPGVTGRWNEQVTSPGISVIICPNPLVIGVMLSLKPSARFDPVISDPQPVAM